MKLHWNTVNNRLKSILLPLMQASEFRPFILAGGTALSLQQGHRVSVDIDLFTDANYASINFDNIEKYLKSNFNYVDTIAVQPIAMRKSYFIGDTKETAVKLDLYYTGKFLHTPVIVDKIRMAHIEDIIAMKLDVIQRESRKKDFWDIHELLNTYSLGQMLEFHQKRYPYAHNPELIINNLLNCNVAIDDFDPVCLKGKIWDFIVLDIIDLVEDYKKKN